MNSIIESMKGKGFFNPSKQTLIDTAIYHVVALQYLNDNANWSSVVPIDLSWVTPHSSDRFGYGQDRFNLDGTLNDFGMEQYELGLKLVVEAEYPTGMPVDILMIVGRIESYFRAFPQVTETQAVHLLIKYTVPKVRPGNTYCFTRNLIMEKSSYPSELAYHWVILVKIFTLRVGISLSAYFREISNLVSVLSTASVLSPIALASTFMTAIKMSRKGFTVCNRVQTVLDQCTVDMSVHQICSCLINQVPDSDRVSIWHC